MDIEIKWRNWFKGIPPQPIKLQIPGWAGDSYGHDDGDVPQPWHCPPFVEGSTYGLELIYPFDSECHIYTDEAGTVKFRGDFKSEVSPTAPFPPFAAFAPGHYGFTSSLDIKCPDDFVIRLEPHPRFFTDTTGTVPIAVPGHIQNWWSRIFFVVFKAPSKNQIHIFRKGEPYAQILIVPKKIKYDIKEMTFEEKAERAQRDTDIDNFSKMISKNTWRDHKGNLFDDKYKVLSSLYTKGGNAEIDKFLSKFKNKQKIKLGFFLNETKKE